MRARKIIPLNRKRKKSKLDKIKFYIDKRILKGIYVVSVITIISLVTNWAYRKYYAPHKQFVNEVIIKCNQIGYNFSDKNILNKCSESELNKIDANVNSVMSGQMNFAEFSVSLNKIVKDKK